MKHLFFSLAISLLAISSVTAQSQEELAPVLSDTFAIGADFQYPAERIVYEMSEIQKPPAYPGGEKELLKYLAENIKYPTANRENNIISMVALTFIVEADGSVSNIKVIRNDGEFAQSVLKVIQQMPCWSPGIINGQEVAVRFWLPVRIKLE